MTSTCLTLAVFLFAADTGFDVASVKRTQPSGFVKGEPEVAIAFSGGTLTMRNVTLKDMILTAYGIKDHQLSGPGWLTADRYDVTAKSSASATPVMLQALLAERFKLETHRETKDLSVLTMVPGKNGPKLGKMKPEGAASIGIEQSKMVFQNYSMPKLAAFLGQRSGGRTVVDGTGIEGFYDFSVDVLDEPSDNPIDVKKAIGMGMRDGSLANRVVQQIGLRLEERKGPVEVIVVDRAEKSPTEN
jgi:uncharacterized protein (TIGR03435 family)